MLMAAQALDTRKFNSSPVLERIKDEIRLHVPELEQDREMSEDFKKVKDLIESDRFLDLTEEFIELG